MILPLFSRRVYNGGYPIRHEVVTNVVIERRKEREREREIER